MAVIKHLEFKVICDNCLSDITDWFEAKNKTQALKIAKAEHNKPFVRGKQFCEDCECEETRPPKTKPVSRDAFKNAKFISAFDLINSK